LLELLLEIVNVATRYVVYSAILIVLKGGEQRRGGREGKERGEKGGEKTGSRHALV